MSMTTTIGTLSAAFLSFLPCAACSSGIGTGRDGGGRDGGDPSTADGRDAPADAAAEESRLCTPGAVSCAGRGSYNRCNMRGDGWETGIACPAGTACMEDGCYTPCAWAEKNRSSIGCVFYAMDLDQADEMNADASPFAIVVSNTDDLSTATVRVEKKTGAAWTAQQTQMVAPNDLYAFRMPADAHVEDTALSPGAAYRVVSDFPVIAYQFNPIDSADQWSNDASLLLPLHTLDKWYIAAGWHQLNLGVSAGVYRGYVTVVGTQDGTQVTVTPSAAVIAGIGVPAIPAGAPYVAVLGDGDALQVATSNDADDLTGTLVEASAPVAVFGGTECSDVPYLCPWCRNASGGPSGSQHRENTCAWCDHMEEQIFPLTTWGKQFVAARAPVRSTGGPIEAAFWRIVASKDGTQVNVTPPIGVTLRFPPGTGVPATLDKGKYLEFEMAGPYAWEPGDALVEASEPVMVVEYIEGQECTNVAAGGGGDPAMILMVPIEQYLEEYIFLTPSTYEVNYVTVIRTSTTAVTIDGIALTPDHFNAVTSGWEVGQVFVSPGVHRIAGTAPFGIVGVGYSPYVSYGYPGGMNLAIINPVI